MVRFRASLVLLLVCGIAAAADLGSRINDALAQVPRGGEAAVAVWDCRADRWAAVAGDPGPLRLASTTKLLISVAALRELGPGFQFITRICALGQITGGSVPGIGVIGGGDPTIDEHFWDKDPESCFRGWAAKIRAAGIARIDGDLVIDNRLFSGPIRPATYPKDGNNAISWFSAPAAAFAYNDGCIDVRAVPTSVGQPCRIETRPRSPRISVDNRTVTASGAGDAQSKINRAADANAVTVSGTYGVATAWYPLAINDSPDLLAGDNFASVLSEAGIVLTGSVRIGAVDPRNGPLLVEHRSDLLPAMTLMNQHSQNFYAEQLLRLVAVRRGQPGSIAAGTAAVLASVLPLMHEDARSVRLLDGSGLSYGNVASARALCRLLASVDASPLGKVLAGTLKDRAYPGVAGEVKTGTLATAACLAGYVEGKRGRLAFAFLLGKGDATTWAWGQGLRDRLFDVVAEEVR